MEALVTHHIQVIIHLPVMILHIACVWEHTMVQKFLSRGVPNWFTSSLAGHRNSWYIAWEAFDDGLQF